MDEKKAYAWASDILKPLDNQEIEIHRLQQVTDRIVQSLLAAYRIGTKNTNNAAMAAIKDTTETIYKVLKEKSDEWIRLHP